MSWPRSVMSNEFKKIMAYRSEFWLAFVGQAVVQLIIARAIWQNIFEINQTSSLKGYSLSTMTLYYLIAPIGMRILTGENIGFLAREIYEGTFSRYLIYPLTFRKYKSLTYLTHSLFYAFNLFWVLICYHLLFSEIPNFPIMILNIFMGCCLFLISAAVYLNLSFCIELFSLWVDNVWSLMVSLRFFVSFLGGALIPLSFFPTFVHDLLLLTPFPYMVSLPLNFLTQVESVYSFERGLFVLIVWYFITYFLSLFIWKKGQYQYTGVGI